MSRWDRNLTSLTEAMDGMSMSRRTMLKRSLAVGMSLPVIGAALAACAEDEDGDDEEDTTDEDDDAAADDEADDEEDEEPDEEEDGEEDDGEEAAEGEPQQGGELRFVTPGEVGSLDTQRITQAIVGQVAWMINEHLFTWDEEMLPAPELANSLEIADDGLSATMDIREGVPFHNGDELTAADVVASLNRWIEISGRSGIFPEVLDNFEQVDDYTIQINLTSVFGAMMPVLCRQNAGCAIYPASIMEEVGVDGRIESPEHYIGTGPYQFVEWQPDVHIHLTRFEDYVGRDEEPSGYAGRKGQYLDDIYFVPVGDMSSAVAGLQTGDYDILRAIPPDNYQTLEDDENVHAQVLEFGSFGVFVPNLRWGILSGYGEDEPGNLLRRAMMIGMNNENIAIAGSGDFYTLHPSPAHQGLPWRTDIDGELWELGYNANDPDRARELIEQAGYDGEEIVWMVARDQPYHYDITLTAVDQWRELGLNVDLQVFDWATIGERRLTVEGVWNGLTTAHSFRPDPVTLTPIAGTEHYGWWDSEAKVEASRLFQEKSEFEERLVHWNELQRLWYTDAARFKVADQQQIDAWTQRVQGWPWTSQVQLHLPNVWIDES